MSRSPIKVGFVGLSQVGWAAAALAPALLHPTLADKYRLTAVSTTSEASATASAQKYSEKLGQPVKAYHGDTAQIASDPDVDLVVVSVRPAYHRAALLPALEARKDVFVEWPAGTGLQESVELAEAAHRAGVRTMVGLQGRHGPVVRKVKELLDTGRIGKVLSVTIIAMAPRELRVCGPEVAERSSYVMERSASMLAIAVGHQLDTLTHLHGDFVSVSATATTQFPTATVIGADGKPTGRTIAAISPDHIAFSGLLKSGALCSVTWRGGAPLTKGRKPFLWEIDGERGSIRLENDQPLPVAALLSMVDPELYVDGERVDVEPVLEGAAGELSESWSAFAKTESGMVANLTAGWHDFARGEGGHHATLEDALSNHRLLDAIERSAKEGRTVML